MSIYQKIKEKIKQQLSKAQSEEELKKNLDTLLQDETPKEAFHHKDLESIKEPTLLFTQLMVQDMRQSCYTYPFIIEKPFSEKSKTYFFKYGHKQPEFDHNVLQNQNYFSYLQDRQTIACMPVVGETEWFRGVEKNQLKKGQIFQMVVERLGQFKLGEVFSAICIYEPEEKLLYFVRRANQEEIKMWNNSEQYLSKQVNFQETRQKLLAVFSQIYERKYSQFLLYSFLSTQHLFISASENHSQLFRKLLPRVCEVKVQAPFKESFFPYKNEEEILIKTDLQMSQYHTFVILDFSNFSSQKEVKIGPEEIDNLKALKVFVEEGNTIYRWVYGESQIKHSHTGLVVKASSIVSPQYVIPQTKKQQKKIEIPQISQADLRSFRSYIHQARKLNPILKDDRKEIQEKIHLQATKFNEISLVKVMELSKLNAKTFGREEIKTSDFGNSCSIFF